MNEKKTWLLKAQIRKKYSRPSTDRVVLSAVYATVQLRRFSRQRRDVAGLRDVEARGVRRGGGMRPAVVGHPAVVGVGLACHWVRLR